MIVKNPNWQEADRPVGHLESMSKDLSSEL